ncbi:MAG: hypothetical protein EKE20_14745 [Candidatus Symbiopectobacterium sp. Dall1.0]|nr:hypothetical protein [Candidatus Symbiopectobacterium sp. Dall1.0]
MSFSYYNKDTGLITHFDGDGKYAVRDFLFFVCFIFFTMIFAIVDEVFGPFDLPWILQYVKGFGRIAVGLLYFIITTVWEWWIVE